MDLVKKNAPTASSSRGQARSASLARGSTARRLLPPSAAILVAEPHPSPAFLIAGPRPRRPSSSPVPTTPAVLVVASTHATALPAAAALDGDGCSSVAALAVDAGRRRLHQRRPPVNQRRLNGCSKKITGSSKKQLRLQQKTSSPSSRGRSGCSKNLRR